ncbi:MAG TPA: TauD/TfdA family dioxygenase [Stellaceae bacterium]
MVKFDPRKFDPRKKDEVLCGIRAHGEGELIELEQRFIDGRQLPLVLQVVRGRDAGIDDIVACLREHKAEIGTLLDRHGALLLRGFDALDSAPRFAAVLDVLASRLLDYVGGTSPRQTVHGQILTATDMPSNYSIPMHQEMSYTASAPDGVAFFCETAPDEGGETTIADARVVTSRISPDVRTRFDAKGVRLRRTLPTLESVHLKPGVQKPWTEVFATTDRDEVGRIASEKGWEVSWLPDNSVQLWQEILPASKTHPRTAERVWFNQTHVFAPEGTIRWAERDERNEQLAVLRRLLAEHPEMVDGVFHGDGTQVSAEDAEHIWDVHQRSEIPVAWRPSDVLLLDNVLAMHGRRSFRGVRRVLAGLIRNETATATGQPSRAAAAAAAE